MKKVFIVYSTDAWNNNGSILTVCTTHKKAVSSLVTSVQNAAKETFKSAGYETWQDMFEDSMYNLKTINQTQEYGNNFDIREQELNKTIF